VSDVVGDGYDRVYAGQVDSRTFQRLWRQHACGDDFPAGYDHISFVTRAEAADLAAATGLHPDELLVDLACGAGGPGLWVAAERGARLLGVDLSSGGLAAATARAERVGRADSARFEVAPFDAVPLEDGAATAVMSVDALQYAPDKAEAFADAHRCLAPGGRLAFLAFEVHADRVADLPVLGDDPVESFAPVVEAAGFTVERCEQTDGWHERVVAAYSAILAAEDALRAELGDDAFGSLAFEMSVTLERDLYRGRPLVVARKV
jgi:ubiquinone/menaquinone biosynthesis C-methylase UbiE